jgi:peroxiredoxin
VKLKIGQVAPAFIAPDLNGRPLRLADFRGRTILLSMYRAAACPLCNVRTSVLINRYTPWRQNGVQLLAFFESSPDAAHRYLDRLNSPFPILLDPTHAIYQTYGLGTSWIGAAYARLFRGSTYREARRLGIGADFIHNITDVDGHFARLPAEFVIGPDQRIRAAYYGRDPGDFMRIAQLDAYLARG